MQLINPYKGIDWSKQQKANLHTHTSNQTINDVNYGSDGAMTADVVIDHYYNAGYKILAITDHDYAADSAVTTYPWETFGRNPDELGMLAIQGKELSNGHHRNSLFNDLGRFNDNIWGSISEIGNRDGLCVINHPERYDEPLEFYTSLFTMFKETIVGIEIFNGYLSGGATYDDRVLWDKINAVTIPQGKVAYGYANDDMHAERALFRNYNFILSPTIIESDVRNAMENGNLYFSRELGGTGNALAPRISNIEVDEANKIVTINSDSENIKWITENTEEIGTGNVFNYADFNKTFFRAEITNEHGITCTQPFAFVMSDLPDEKNSSEIIGAKIRHYNTWMDIEVKGFAKNKWRKVVANKHWFTQ